MSPAKLLASMPPSLGSHCPLDSPPGSAEARVLDALRNRSLRLPWPWRKVMLSIALLACGTALGAQQEPLVPCGPKAGLPAELATNVAEGSRCFELRIYRVDHDRIGTKDFVGDIDLLHQRFREEEVAIFERHGAEILAVFQSMEEPDTMVWMLAYRDRAHREEVWAAFRDDPAWKALYAKYKVPVKPEAFLLSAADYSPLK